MPDKSLADHQKICLLTDGYSTPFLAKTAISILRYRTNDVVAVIEQSNEHASAQDLFGTGGPIPVVPSLASVADTDALYLGIAPPGGRLPATWRPIILEALSRKLDVVSGLHEFLADDKEFQNVASKMDVRLIDVRRNQENLTATGSDFREGCLRVHTVGRDCSVGKMVTTLEVQRGLAAQGQDARFLATGQTGIMIDGDGVPIDCVVGDFINGAAEAMIRRNDHHEFLLVEGQGSISHPAFSAVTLGLLHGVAPDGLIFCYEAGRDQVKGFENAVLPSVDEQLAAYCSLANLRHPCTLIGIAVNTRLLSPEESAAEIGRAESDWGLPACDVYRDGPGKLVAACLKLKSKVQRTGATAV